MYGAFQSNWFTPSFILYLSLRCFAFAKPTAARHAVSNFVPFVVESWLSSLYRVSLCRGPSRRPRIVQKMLNPRIKASLFRAGFEPEEQRWDEWESRRHLSAVQHYYYLISDWASKPHGKHQTFPLQTVFVGNELRALKVRNLAGIRGRRVVIRTRSDSNRR